MKFTKIRIIHKNKNKIHKNRTLGKKPGQIPDSLNFHLSTNLDINLSKECKYYNFSFLFSILSEPTETSNLFFSPKL